MFFKTKDIPFSPIKEIQEKAEARGAISLAQGIPRFLPPLEVRRAAMAAILRPAARDSGSAAEDLRMAFLSREGLLRSGKRSLGHGRSAAGNECGDDNASFSRRRAANPFPFLRSFLEHPQDFARSPGVYSARAPGMAPADRRFEARHYPSNQRNNSLSSE